MQDEQLVFLLVELQFINFLCEASAPYWDTPKYNSVTEPSEEAKKHPC